MVSLCADDSFNILLLLRVMGFASDYLTELVLPLQKDGKTSDHHNYLDAQVHFICILGSVYTVIYIGIICLFHHLKSSVLHASQTIYQPSLADIRLLFESTYFLS